MSAVSPRPSPKIIPRVHLSPRFSKTNKEKFLANPAVNPVTGRKIKCGGVTYKKLVVLYGKPA